MANNTTDTDFQYQMKMPEAARQQIPPSNHNFFTLAAVGFIAYYVVAMWHELLGHGLALYLYGARHFVLTSTSLGATDEFSPGSTSASRVVDAAGSLSTILLATFRRKNAISNIDLMTGHTVGMVFGGDFARIHSRNEGEWTMLA